MKLAGQEGMTETGFGNEAIGDSRKGSCRGWVFLGSPSSAEDQ